MLRFARSGWQAVMHRRLQVDDQREKSSMQKNKLSRVLRKAVVVVVARIEDNMKCEICDINFLGFAFSIRCPHHTRLPFGTLMHCLLYPLTSVLIKYLKVDSFFRALYSYNVNSVSETYLRNDSIVSTPSVGQRASHSLS